MRDRPPGQPDVPVPILIAAGAVGTKVHAPDLQYAGYGLDQGGHVAGADGPADAHPLPGQIGPERPLQRLAGVVLSPRTVTSTVRST